MRLIDADLLKKSIAKWLQGGDPQETVMVKLDDIAVSVIMEIDKQPTAYDVEKVVAEVKKLSFEWLGDIRTCDVIKLVRKGGVE